MTIHGSPREVHYRRRSRSARRQAVGDAPVDELAATALPAWHDFAFKVQHLRADYLLR